MDYFEKEEEKINGKLYSVINGYHPGLMQGSN
jgi:hypothetical protein